MALQDLDPSWVEVRGRPLTDFGRRRPNLPLPSERVTIGVSLRGLAPQHSCSPNSAGSGQALPLPLETVKSASPLGRCRPYAGAGAWTETGRPLTPGSSPGQAPTLSPRRGIKSGPHLRGRGEFCKGLPEGRVGEKARARGVPQRGWGSDTPYCTRSDYSVPVGVGPGGGAWAGVCRALGCVNSVRPMCPVFRAMCQLWRGMCPLLRGICPVFRAMCSLSRPMCSVFRAMCSPSRQMCSVFPAMCSVFAVMCSVSADARPGGLVACEGRRFLAAFGRTRRLSEECEAAREAWWLSPSAGSGPTHHERGAGRVLPDPLPPARPIHAGFRSLLRHLHP